MKQVKRIAMFLSAVFVLSTVMVFDFGVDVSATTIARTSDEAAAWAISLTGQEIDYDHQEGVQCVDIIYYYLTDFWGHPELASGNAIDFAYKTLPSGWTYTSTPEPGDIVVWSQGTNMGCYIDSQWIGNEYADHDCGHVGIVVGVRNSTIVTIEQRTYAGNGYQGGLCARPRERTLGTALTYIRPSFIGDDRAPEGYVTDQDCEERNGQLFVGGWAYDPDEPSVSIPIHIYANGTYIGMLPTNAYRPDVNEAKGITGNHGFNGCFSLPSGQYTIDIYAINSAGGSTHNQLIKSCSVTIHHTHTIVTDSAVPPTATETGLTEGSHCSECGEVIVPQEVIPALGSSGWRQENGNTYYYDSNGVMVTGWQEIDGNTYYFKASGVMITGWKTWGSSTYYFGDDGIMRTGWQEIDGHTYYFKTSGVMITGWKTWGSKTYYFGADGIMRTGWQEIDGNTYYFKTNGTMITGWKTWGSKTYYFGTDGIMRTGWQEIDGHTYYFKTSGVMVTGFKVLSGKTYYFGTDGIMRTGLQTIDGNIYYFKTNGVMLTNTSRTIDGVTYYFGSDGIASTEAPEVVSSEAANAIDEESQETEDEIVDEDVIAPEDIVDNSETTEITEDPAVEGEPIDETGCEQIEDSEVNEEISDTVDETVSETEDSLAA